MKATPKVRAESTAPRVAIAELDDEVELAVEVEVEAVVEEMSPREHCCQQAHNIKVQQMLHFVLFDLWRFGSKCWTIYICYKHSVAAAFIMALIACWISFFREF